MEKENKKNNTEKHEEKECKCDGKCKECSCKKK